MEKIDFKEIGLSAKSEKLFSNRANFSVGRLKSLEGRLRTSEKVSAIPDLCVFSAGSYGRLEASEHSDIDLFFITMRRKEVLDEINVPTISMFSDVIEAGRTLDFPKFSNDGEYLKLLLLEDIEKNLGSRFDDFHNHFTARMLMLLESRPVFGGDVYREVVRSVVESYFRDYSHHPDDFKPTFLVNDIIRFWKTLCLNYEHGRNQEDEREKIKQKIKNFKLKYSRLLTCFATIGLLSTYKDTISPADVFSICERTPSQRFRSLSDFLPEIAPKLAEALESYAWFMELTALSKGALEEYFFDKDRRVDAFNKAQGFGDLVYDVLFALSQKNNALRYMVV